MGLPDSEEIMTLALFVLTQYRRVTDGHVAVAKTRASIHCSVARVKVERNFAGIWGRIKHE